MSFRFVAPLLVAATGSCGALYYRHRASQAQEERPTLPERFRSFASIGNGHYMVLEDFILSCCAVPPPTTSSSSTSSSASSSSTSSESSSGLKLTPSAQQLFQSIDADGDGRIDFPEYCLLATFLSNSDEHFRTAFYMFDLDKSGKLDFAEFQHVMAALCVDPKARTALGLDNLPPLVDTRKRKTPKKDGDLKSKKVVNENKENNTAAAVSSSTTSKSASLLETSGIIQRMFGKDCEKKLAVEEFLTLVRKLRWEVRRVEFQQYLQGQSRDDAVRLSDVRSMLGVPVEGSEKNPNQLVAWTSYTKLFDLIREAPAVQRGLEILQDAKRKANGGEESEEDGGATKLEFARALRAAKLSHFTPQDISMFFDVFDSDGSGTIDAEEFGKVCELRDAFFSAQRADFSQPDRNAVQQFFFCMQQRQ